MDGVRLTPDTIERLRLGDFGEWEVEELLLLRALQSYEENEYAPPSEDDLVHITRWGDDITTGQTLLKMVLCGELYIMYDPQEDDISFRLAPSGQDKARSLGMDIPELPSLEC